MKLRCQGASWGSGVRGAGPHEAAAEPVQVDAGTQGQPWCQWDDYKPYCDPAKSFTLASCVDIRCYRNVPSLFCESEPQSYGCQGPAPSNARHLGLTCHSPLHRHLAAMAGWTPGRCQTCARCVVGTTARAACRTALSRLEEPEVGARLPPPQPPRSLRSPEPWLSQIAMSPRGSDFGEQAAAGIVACQ